MSLQQRVGSVAVVVGVFVGSAGVALADPDISSASSHDFGSLRVSTAAVTSSSTMISIRNEGTTPLTINSTALAGTHPGDFAIVTLPAGTVPAGMGTSVTVRFDPTAPGPRAAQLQIGSNDPDTPLATIELTGSGTTGVIGVADVSFGVVTHGTTAIRSVIVDHTGAAPKGPLHVTSAALTGGGGWITFVPNGPACTGATCTFPSGGLDIVTTAEVGVRCDPPANAAIATQTATITFTSDSDPGGDAVAEISCTLGRAELGITPATAAFMDVAVNPATPPAIAVTLDNSGNDPLTIAPTKVGTAALTSLYTLGGACAAGCTIAAGANAQLTITFNPTAPTNPNANISIDLGSNDPDGAGSIAVTGRGVAPDLTPPGSPVAFGSIDVGKTGANVPLTITNTGTAPLVISSAGLSSGAADYTVTSGTVGPQLTTVPPTQSLTWQLACNPTDLGARPGVFQITSNSFMEGTVEVTLSCTGLLGRLVVIQSPTPLDFGTVAPGAFATRTFQLRNTGNVAVTGIGTVIAPAAKGYSIDAATPVPATLAAGATANLTARFTPLTGADGGDATYTFSGTWGSAPVAASSAVLSVTGAALTAKFDLTPLTVNFGNLRYDQTVDRTFCIVNSGQAPVTFMTQPVINAGPGTTTGEFAVTGAIRKQTACGVGGTAVNLPQTLNANEVLQVTVTADPANRLGLMQAKLIVTSTLPADPSRELDLVGNSTSAAVALAPAPMIDFGAVDVQGPAATRTITITNTGTAPLDLSGFTRTGAAAFTATLPTGATMLAPGQALDLVVSYKPVTVTAGESAQITHMMSGIFNGPTMQTIPCTGRGIDRNLELAGTPTFPDTFRNPGDQAPIRAARVRNTGEVPLKLIAAMVTNDPDVWQLLNPEPIDVPSGATHEYQIRFVPKRGGTAPPATLRITNDDDSQPTVTVLLTGRGLDRGVRFEPDVIRLGLTPVGVPVTLDNALIVASTDTSHAFTIRTIELPDGTPFTIEGDTDGVELPANGQRTFGVTFTPETAGPFTTTVKLYLDSDPESLHSVTLEGTAVFVDAHGGGGCATGGGDGAGALAIGLALAAVLGLRRRARGAAVAAAVLVGAAAPAARADDLALSIFDPAPATTSNGFQLQAPDVGANGDWVLSAIGTYASDPLVLGGAPNGKEQAIVGRSLGLNLGGAIAFLGRFEAGAHIPLYTQDGDRRGNPLEMIPQEPVNGTARGDLVVHAKARLLRARLDGEGAFSLGLGAHVTLPTATAGQFTGTEDPTVRAQLLAALTPGAFGGRLTLSFNAGAVLRSETRTFFNVRQKSGAVWGLGVQVRALERLWLAGEVFGDVVPTGRDEAMEEGRVLAPIEWLAGLRWRPDRRLTVGVAGGRGLTSAIGTPAFRGVLALTYAPGAPPLRPLVPPKPDGDQDGDGLLDSADRCPSEAEDADAFEDADGCPDPDNDGDSIADALDKCPLEAEDQDDFQDTDGCIDPDDDGDAIADKLDRCPREPEDLDGFQDKDGCPEADNDKDGIADGADKCVNDPETINGKQDDDGCPDKGDTAVVLSPDRIETLEAIQFTPQHKIAKPSANVLAQVGATLRAHTEIARLRVTVHVQPTADEDKDLEVTQARAAAVREWLIQWGVAGERVEARGFGGTKPLIAPDKKGAAALNTRVELIILERK